MHGHQNGKGEFVLIPDKREIIRMKAVAADLEVLERNAQSESDRNTCHAAASALTKAMELFADPKPTISVGPKKTP